MADWLTRASALAPRTELFIDGRFVSAASGRTVDDIAGRDGSRIASAAEVPPRMSIGRSRPPVVPSTTGAGRPSRRRLASASCSAWRISCASTTTNSHWSESLDVGMPIRDTLEVDVPSAATTFQWYAETIDKVYGEIGPTGPDALPWNYPLIISAWKLGAALATGNSVVLKPASQSPLSALRLAELAAEAGLPDGVVDVVTGPGAVIGDALARHPSVDKIAFTGSTEVGKSLMRAVGESDVKAISLELGGKSPRWSWPTSATSRRPPWRSAGASSTTAARHATQGRGWSSTAPCEGNSSSGSPHSSGNSHPASRSSQGPGSARWWTIASSTNVLGYVELGRREGANVVAGGQRVREESGGSFIPPTILDGVSNSMRVAREEIFGPVLTVIEFEDEAESIAIANDSPYSMAAGLWTRDVNRAHRLARRIRAGIVWVNTFESADITVPFGGFKQSGFGRDKKGLHALDGYTQPKTTWFDLSG